MPKRSSLKITPSSGNVFRDLGFSTDEAEHLLVRADLLIQLQKVIASRGLTQTKAATILRVTQVRTKNCVSTVSDTSRNPRRTTAGLDMK
jgi:predicted XRE-type DNA-binding protein